MKQHRKLLKASKSNPATNHLGVNIPQMMARCRSLKWKQRRRCRLIPIVPLKLTDQQTGPFQYIAFVFEITQLSITTTTDNRRDPSWVAVQTNIQFTGQISQGSIGCLQLTQVVHVCLCVCTHSDVAATVISQLRKKKSEKIRSDIGKWRVF